MKLKLLVRVIEGKNIPAMDPNGLSDPYVKLALGRQKFKSKVAKKTLNPTWCEEFTFRVDDLKDELVISVLDEDKYFNDDFVGQIKVRVGQVFEAKDKSLGTAWYTLHPKNKKAKIQDCGEILLTICFSQNNTLLDLPPIPEPAALTKRFADESSSSRSLRLASNLKLDETGSSKDEKHSFAGRIAKIFSKNMDAGSASFNEANDVSDFESVHSMEMENKPQEQQSSLVDFEELMKSMETKDQGGELPSNLSGGVVLEQLYGTAPLELNSLIFSPDSNFLKTTSEAQGATELQVGPWKFEESQLKRVVSYVNPPTKFTKAMQATEDQLYLKANGKDFAVLVTVNTPDAPYGKTFKVELLYCITPGPEQPSGELSAQLVISWRISFVQSTMMKGMIEGGVKQGLKDNFEQYGKLLAQNVKPLDSKEVGSEKDQLLASLEVERVSDWQLAVQYFANLMVVSAVLMGLYVSIHLWLATPSPTQGLEFVGLDLPDSVSELIVCAVLVLQGKRVLELVSRFMQARVQKGSDHGIKAQGDGWLLTVALMEGSNFSPVNSRGLSDPYVVFTCNGKTRTSSIKFQKSDPLWNEIFEFDAMDEPPSMLDVEVFDFDGPFGEATSLGHAEINFLKSNILDLSDVWIPLKGKLAQTCQSKLHLRIFLNNSRGTVLVKDYISKMEKEVGKKIKLRSPQANSAFQKIFGLPPEEFLINDFSCHLKRRMPLQGRLFLSVRMIGFHSDLFGHKTKFFFLWEDIEDIQVKAPTLSSMGSPIIIMILRPGRGFDARHGARKQDPEGRLKFHFHSFVSFDAAHRTIMALWKTRALSPEQKVQMVEEESDANDANNVDDECENFLDEMDSKKEQGVDEESDAGCFQAEETSSFLGAEDVDLSLVYSSMLSLPSSFFMELFSGSEVDQRARDKAGLLNYTHTPWESEKPDVYQRQLRYRFDKSISRFKGSVTSTQQKSELSGKSGWLVEEVMTMDGLPLSDYFTIHLRYQVEDLPSRSVGCTVQVFFGMAWSKYTRHQKRITKSILSNLLKRMKVMFGALEKEYISEHK